jgi:hypothetical protein
MGPVELPIPFTVMIAYARKDEYPALQVFLDTNDGVGLHRYLTRGAKYTKEDRDGPYTRAFPSAAAKTEN